MASGIWHSSDLIRDLYDFALAPPETVEIWGKTLVVAPHPDDESLGCGGAIALLCRYGLPPTVLFVSDGTGSHPNSQRYPAFELRALREAESRESLASLGTSSSIYMRLKDGAVPRRGTAGFDEAVNACVLHLSTLQPETLLLPWRRDPHSDHRATSEIVRAALSELRQTPRLLEYPIWAWERADADDLPRLGEVRGFRLDIADAVDAKQRAIAAHRSQVTHLIDDDPQGFWLSPEVLAHFAAPWEVYLEAYLGKSVSAAYPAARLFRRRLHG